jgi:hypothetical protein
MVICKCDNKITNTQIAVKWLSLKEVKIPDCMNRYLVKLQIYSIYAVMVKYPLSVGVKLRFISRAIRKPLWLNGGLVKRRALYSKRFYKWEWVFSHNAPRIWAVLITKEKKMKGFFNNLNKTK